MRVSICPLLQRQAGVEGATGAEEAVDDPSREQVPVRDGPGDGCPTRRRRPRFPWWGRGREKIRESDNNKTDGGRLFCAGRRGRCHLLVFFHDVLLGQGGRGLPGSNTLCLRTPENSGISLSRAVRLAGLEPTTYRLGGDRCYPSELQALGAISPFRYLTAAGTEFSTPIWTREGPCAMTDRRSLGALVHA